MDFKIEKVERHDDERGKLIILLKNNDLPNRYIKFGEVFYITFVNKGILRANHYHKKWREWFVVVSGKIRVLLEDIKTKKSFSTVLNAEGKELVRLEVGPFVAHAFISLTKDACLLNYSSEVWKKQDVIPYTFIAKNEKKSPKIRK